MRAELKEYQAVEEAAMKFVKSVAEGNSKYAKEFCCLPGNRLRVQKKPDIPLRSFSLTVWISALLSGTGWRKWQRGYTISLVFMLPSPPHKGKNKGRKI